MLGYSLWVLPILVGLRLLLLAELQLLDLLVQ